MIAHCQNAHISRALQSIKDVVFTKSSSKSVQARCVRLSPSRDALLVVSNSPTNDARMALRIPANIECASFGAPVYGCDLEELLRLLRNAPAEISLTGNESGHVRLSLPEGFLGIEPIETSWLGTDWPVQKPESQPIEADVLASLLRQTAPYTSDDNTRDAISCVHLVKDDQSHVLAEALDAHQYANARETAPGLHAALPETGLLVRRQYAFCLASLLSCRTLGNEVRMSLSRWSVTFSGEHGSLFLPVLDYTFPSSQDFLEKARAAENVLTLEAGETLRILRMLEPLVNDTYRSVRCDLSPDTVRFSTIGGTAGEMRLPADYSGTLDRIAFPLKQLRAIVEDNAMAETLRFGFSSMEGPCLVTGGKNRETVLMPMKIFEHEYYTGGGAV